MIRHWAYTGEFWDRAVRRLRPGWQQVALVLIPPPGIALLLAGWETATIVAALAIPVVAALLRPGRTEARLTEQDALTGLASRRALVAALDHALYPNGGAGRISGSDTAVGMTGALVIEIDRFKLLEERHDHAVIERILRVTADRLSASLRANDLAGRLDGPGFAVALAPDRRLDLEAAIQLAARVQRAMSEPIAADGATLYITVSVGFSLASRLRSPDGEAVLRAATTAMIEAQRSGPSAIRSYSEAMRARIVARNSLADEVAGALERGEITAFFQPQLSTATGEISGFETLARWHHPERGLVPPVEFLPALEQAGLMTRLGEIMIFDALTAMRQWDIAGLSVPRIGVNFSNEELCDPRLVDRIGWELDRFDLAPGRLVIEVLETVVATKSEDVVIHNLAGLARLGCCLDLDDFGTGHAAITNIRRFSIKRIKIDRSFITRIDHDPEQQKMVSAILTMAEKLGLDTLAEGVETMGERAMLTTLGCGHVQGFGIARPMPLQETERWVRDHYRRLAGVVLPHRRVV